MRFLERLLFFFERPPWPDAFRIMFGYFLGASWSRLRDNTPSWSVFPYFLMMLIALRLAPAIVRRLVPFGAQLQATWFEKRQLAKRFDSYQWRKLIWLGVGLTIYVLLSGQLVGHVIIVTVICLLSGASGLWMWERHSRLPDGTDMKVHLLGSRLKDSHWQR